MSIHTCINYKFLSFLDHLRSYLLRTDIIRWEKKDDESQKLRFYFENSEDTSGHKKTNSATGYL